MIFCHCDDFQHAPLPGPEILIEKQRDGSFLWRAAFFSLGRGYQQTGGFAETQLAAIEAVKEFEAECYPNGSI